MNKPNRQKGGSAIGLIITLIVLAYAVFVAIQYVPQYIESSNVKTILDNIVDKHNKEPLDSMSVLQSAIENQLYINQMGDLKDSFTVTQYRGDYVIKVHYERELDLLYEKKRMVYEKKITLK